MSQHAHAVAPRALASDFFWRFMALAMLFAVAWVAWVVWQLMPRPVVTDLAYQSQRARETVAPSKPDPRRRPRSPPRRGRTRDGESERGPPLPHQGRRGLAGRRARQVELRHAAPRDRADHPIPQRRSSASDRPSKASGSSTKTASAQPRPEDPVTGTGKIDRRANTSAKNRAEQDSDAR